MGLTKRQVIEQAYEEIGKAGYEFDLQPEELQSALRRLDSMMLSWATLGFRVGYSGGDGTGDIDAEAEVPGWAYEALYLNLAVKIAPSFGKTPSPLTLQGAKAAKDQLAMRTVTPALRVPTGYGGAGYRYWGNGGNLPVPENDLVTGPDQELDIA